ncbi:MAG TPA: response regulator transcription factor [Vicinamibacterales bacterium]|nr:response regulator transcription factor [Vicinamibacterales bacterium]
MQTILVVEDDPRIAEIEADYLRHAGFAVALATTGEQALDLARDRRPALVVLDLRLPRMDGLDVARALRHDSEVPIIMVTARVEESDRLRGLEIGADDYLTKPFSPRELVARVRAVLRRTAVGHDVRDRIRLGDLSIDLPRMTVTRGRQPVDVTATEFQILAAMARQPGRVFTRAQLLDAVQADGGEAFDRAIDAHIKNIRRKLEPDPRSPRYLLTVYGVGYKCADL